VAGGHSPGVNRCGHDSFPRARIAANRLAGGRLDGGFSSSVVWPCLVFILARLRNFT
jgi:hypothetical protein